MSESKRRSRLGVGVAKWEGNQPWSIGKNVPSTTGRKNHRLCQRFCVNSKPPKNANFW